MSPDSRDSQTFPSLAEAYRRHLSEHGFTADVSQETLVACLQNLLDDLVEWEQRHSGWRAPLARLKRFWGRQRNSEPPVRGIYVWGGVGRGKTFLLNLFYRHLPIQAKKRLHFHEFMRKIHAHLSQLRKTGNVREPLEKIARDFARRYRLLYLDEFHVIDIADAMILGALLKRLTRHGVALALTSNFPPWELYRDGLQRQNFLPAIELIERHLDVFELGAGCDYRLQFLGQTNLYRTPADAAAERAMEESFEHLAQDNSANSDGKRGTALEINDRLIPTRRRAGGIVWFDFEALCGGPRSPGDYLEIAQCHETVLVSGIPIFERRDDLARRFINLIDTLYDHRVRFIASASAAPGQLYPQGRLADEFRRTTSRLTEMQSSDYIAQVHK